MESCDGVLVQVNLQQDGTKDGALKAAAALDHDDINVAAATAPEVAPNGPGCGCSAAGLWALVLLGCVFPPFWWAGVAAGLRWGKADEALIKRRKKLQPKQACAWWACVVMSVISSMVLILVLAIHLCRSPPQHEGPFYLTLSGPQAAFPDLRDPTKLQRVQQAVHGALDLGASYPARNIAVWLQDKQEFTPPTPSGRHLLSDKVSIVLLGYSLLKTNKLPAALELRTRVDAPGLSQAVADRLADASFVPEERFGQLHVIATSTNRLKEVVQAVHSGDSPADNSLLASMVAIGTNAPGHVDCTGSWHATDRCSACESGFTLEAFSITQQAAHGGAQCQAAQGDTRPTTTPCTNHPPCAPCSASTPLPALDHGSWQCSSGTPHRGNCSGVCDSGYSSRSAVTAECVDGAYSTARGACRLPAVLVVFAAHGSRADDVKTSLGAPSALANLTVDAFDANRNTPSLDQLLAYDAALVFADMTFDWKDPVALGDNLADYFEAGGRVVLAPLACSVDRHLQGAGRPAGMS